MTSTAAVPTLLRKSQQSRKLQGARTVRFDVAVIGAGPIGLMTANLLGLYRVKTLLIEKNGSTVTEPRAVSIDDESLRAVQAVGLAPEVLPELMLDYGSDYKSPSGRVFARARPKTKEYGYPRRNGFCQPVLEAQLRRGLDRFDHVTSWFEHRLRDLTQDDSGVALNIETPQGGLIDIACEYVAACDGATSTVREILGLQLEGSTYDQNWIIVDLAETRNPFHHTEVYCDARRPGISLPGPGRTRRYEFMMLPGETREQVLDPANMTRMLDAVGPDAECKRVRTTVYRFHARMARQWSYGRVSLLGDAAHLTPPFAGQGMNSGIRDAFNYAWKVAEVVKGTLGPGLLASYELERSPHAWALILMAQRMGRVMMPSSRLWGFLVEMAFRVLGLYSPAREYIMQMKYKPKPKFQRGFFVPDTKTHRTTIVGRMFPQPSVQLQDGTLALLDDIIGNGFCCLCLHDVPAELDRLLKRLGPLSPKLLCILPQELNFPLSNQMDYVRDYEGLLDKIFEDYANHILVLRPDRYVAAAIPPNKADHTMETLDKLLAKTWDGHQSFKLAAVQGTPRASLF